MSPEVSIIIPVYNAERFLGQCLESVIGQTMENFEVIAVDDGSTDASLAILQEYATRDGRIRVLRQKNSFAGVARNAGMEQACGKYFSFLDADDFFESSFLENMLSRAKETDADVVVCKSLFYDDRSHEKSPIAHSLRYVDLNKVYSGYELGDNLFRFCVGWPWDKIYKADFVRKHGLLFQETRTTNDAFFVYMSLALAERVSFSSEELVCHRVNSGDTLEGTRHLSWHCAYDAVDKIEEDLSARHLMEHFKRSFDNWVADFLVWNYTSLPASIRSQAFARMSDRLERIAAQGPGYIENTLDEESVSLFGMNREQLLEAGLLDKKKLRDEKWEIDRLSRAAEYWEGEASKCELLLEKERADFREAQTQSLTEYNELRGQFDAICGSLSYRLGRSLTAVPRKIRNMARGR